MSASASSLSDSIFPKDKPNQTYASVKAINTGFIYLPDLEVFQDSVNSPASQGSTVPVLAFLIDHPTRGKALFDLGLRKDNVGYPPALDENHIEEFKVECKEGIADKLKKGGVDLGDVKRIIYSHLHWDHVGDPTQFPNAEIIVGAECTSLLADAYPKNAESAIQEFPSTHRATFVDFAQSSPALVTPFGVFDRALDFYNDGSVYLVDTPGHMPGHLCALARVAHNAFVLLAGDVCHNRLCYDPGERIVSEVNHQDIEVARKTVALLTKIQKEVPEVIVILAHESERAREMPLFPDELNSWANKAVETRRRSL